MPEMTWEEKEHLVANYICAECENPLVLKTRPPETGVHVTCGTDDSHVGYKPSPTLTEYWRQGGAVSVAEVNAIERSRPAITSVDTAAAIWKEKFPTLTPAGAYQAAIYSLQLGLDPRFGEIACVEYSSKGSKIPSMMIMALGWRRLAARETPGKAPVAPVLSDITDKDEKVRLDASGGDWVSTASGFLESDREDMPLRVSVGIYRRAEYDAAVPGQGKREVPARRFPQNQARRRAERHWYEENVPEAVEAARRAYADFTATLDMQQADAVIDAEFKQLPVGSGTTGNQRPSGAGTAPRADDRPPSMATRAQEDALLSIGKERFHWDRAGLEDNIGKPLASLTKSQASDLISRWTHG